MHLQLSDFSFSVAVTVIMLYGDCAGRAHAGGPGRTTPSPTGVRALLSLGLRP